jgi:hypothetical protein
VLAALTALGAVGTMAAGIIITVGEVSATRTVSVDTVRNWVALASTGFMLPTELCLVGAAILVMVDRMSGTSFPGERVVLPALAFLAWAGVVIDLAAMTAFLTQPNRPEGFITLPATKVAIFFSYLGPALLAALAGWLTAWARRAGRSAQPGELAEP